MASSSGPEFVIPSGCSHCSKIDVKEFPCPTLGGRGRNLYSLSGVPIHHPQIINRSSCQCCAGGTHQELCPSIPVRLNSFCNCLRCRRTQQMETIDRRVPLPHHQHLLPCNTNWVNPLEVQNNNLGNVGYVLPNQAHVLAGHVGMASYPIENVQVNGMPGLSYHRHNHYHHYHYHPHAHSRNIHPYSFPVFHPRIRRQSNIRQNSRDNNTRDEQIGSHNIFSIFTPAGRVQWDTALDPEQLENVVSFGEQLVDQKPRGLSKSVVENLPSYRITSKDKNKGEARCVICLMDFEEKHQVRILPCSHEYHTKCIDKWLKSNRTCPICRKEIKIS